MAAISLLYPLFAEVIPYINFQPVKMCQIYFFKDFLRISRIGLSSNDTLYIKFNPYTIDSLSPGRCLVSDNISNK